MRLRTLSTLTLVGALALAACGGDDDAADTTAAAPTTVTAAVETTEAAETTAAPGPPRRSRPPSAGDDAGDDRDDRGADDDGDRRRPSRAPAATCPAPTPTPTPPRWRGPPRSTRRTGYDAKAAVIADAEALRPTIEAYTPAGEVVGGITLEPTDVVITGDTAAITYKVLFAGTSPYPEQEGTVAARRRGVGRQPRRVLRVHGHGPEPLQLMTDLESRFDTAVELTVDDRRPARVGGPERRPSAAGCCWPSGCSCWSCILSIAVGAKSIPLRTVFDALLRLRPDEQRPPDHPLAARPTHRRRPARRRRARASAAR